MTSDLTAAPFQLDEAGIAWVRQTIDAMTEDQKVGQLFINLNNRFDDTFVNRIVDDYHPGGMRYNHTDSASIQAHIRHAQSRSTVPLLVASNIEAGGNGACNDGTLVASPLQTASTPDTDAAYQMGLVGGRESRALGCNWAFTPIVDIHHNWRSRGLEGTGPKTSIRAVTPRRTDRSTPPPCHPFAALRPTVPCGSGSAD